MRSLVLKRQGGRQARRAHYVRFFAIASVFVVFQALLFALSLVSVEIINATRAYASGEALYSKAQKSAVIRLHRYVHTGDLTQLAAYSAFIAIPRGDHRARTALEQAWPKMSEAAAGFRAGGNHPDDVNVLSTAFVVLGGWEPFAAAIEDWRHADLLIADLDATADAITALMRLEPPGSPEFRPLLSRVDRIDEELTQLQTSFSNHMGVAARTARTLTILALTVSTIAFVAAGTLLTWHVLQRGAKTELMAIESERRFKDFAHVSSDWFWETDRNLRVAFLSKRFAEATGLSAVRLIGANWTDIVRTFRLTPSGEGIGARARSFRDVQFRYADEAGLTRYLSLSGAALRDETGRIVGYRGTGSDVTAAVQATEAVVAAKTQAEEANRAKSDFLANMSHELRTPLNAIVGYTEMLKEDADADAALERSQDLARILRSSHHLLSLINDVLDLSRIEAGRLELHEEPFALRTVIESAIHLCRPAIEQNQLSLVVRIPSALPEVQCDQLKIKQVFVNLLSNAAKFTISGGSIVVTVEEELNGSLECCVKDSGIGMRAEDIAVALSPFGQVESGLSRKFAGSGLGLPLAKRLVEAHGGVLSVESEPNQGTSVRFTIPAHRVAADDLSHVESAEDDELECAAARNSA